MRFCNKLSRHVVAPWDSHYIPYQQLKALLKVAQRNGREPSEDFYVSFVQATVNSTTFFLQHHSALHNDEKHLEEQWVDGALAEHRTDLVFLNLMTLLEALKELLWFCQVNYEAMSHICVKLARFDQACSPELERYRSIVHGHCAEYSQAYSKCVDQLDRLQARVATYHSGHSASQIDPYTLDQDFGVVSALLHESDSTSVMRSGHSQTLLHLSATYGMINLCMHVLSNVSPVEKYILSKDGSGFTPLHVSVARGHVEVARLLLSAMDKLPTLIPDDLLHMALRREDDAMVKVLVSSSVGLKHKSSSGESCLYIVAQLGREDYLRLLLPMFGSDFVDAADFVCQWTPLFIGCVEGHASTVRLLMDAGADASRLDYLGWTAQEHAAFRGHLAVAEMFTNMNATPQVSCSLSRNIPQHSSASRFEVTPGLAHVALNLGSMQERGPPKSSTLNLVGTLCHGLVLSISTSESPASIERMGPLLDDPVDDTLILPVKNPVEAAIVFNIRKRHAERNDHDSLIGTGVALLYTSTCLGAQHGTLLREQTVPILCKDTLSSLGTIAFSFLIMGPYHQLGSPSPSTTCLGASSSVQLVGHRGACLRYTVYSHADFARGLGQNSPERFFQLGENTAESFLAARKQGATFVEFDVQLTKDFVPVLFHDYSLSESGTDVPIHDVTLDQSMHASSIQSPRGNSFAVDGSSGNHTAHYDVQFRRPRSRSLTTAHEKGAEEVKNRMKHTVDYLNKGFKPNTRGDFVQDTFATLKDALCKVPENIGFGMEIKYPRLHEALDAGIAPVSIEINVFVDTILDELARFGGGRNIILSSFTPEICILLAIKQRSYPVLFITNAGKRPLSDKEKRAGSLQAAVRFAKQWWLAGIMVAADCLVMCPRLIGFVKSQGLVCGSYNGLNNEPKNVELQVKAGIDLIVADRVGLVSQTLEKLVA